MNSFEQAAKALADELPLSLGIKAHYNLIFQKHLEAFAREQNAATDFLNRVYAETVRKLGEGYAKLKEQNQDLQSRLAKVEEEKRELVEALEKSVELQSHYAKLLNMHDGGERKIFASSKSWMERLKALDKAALAKGEEKEC